MQDKKISRAQRRLEEGGQGAMAMDTAALRKNEEILALETQVKRTALACPVVCGEGAGAHAAATGMCAA